MRTITQQPLFKRLLMAMFLVVPVLGWLFNKVYEETIFLDEYLLFTLGLALPIYCFVSLVAIAINYHFFKKNK